MALKNDIRDYLAAKGSMTDPINLMDLVKYLGQSVARIELAEDALSFYATGKHDDGEKAKAALEAMNG